MPDKHSVSIAYALLLISQVLLASNMIFARLIPDVEPFTLAFLRWAFASTILLLFCRNSWPLMWRTFRNHSALLFLCGFLAFWICGGIIYWGLKYSTATNGILIYTTSPVIILILEGIYRGRAVRIREIIGILVALLGLFFIIFEGDVNKLLQLQFNPGDIMYLVSAIAWAVYSVILKAKQFEALDAVPLLTIVALCGAVILMPFAAYEVVKLDTFPTSQFEWLIIGCIVVFASIFSFSSFQTGIKTLGSSIAGIFMYLMAPCGIFLAWLILGEILQDHHTIGTIFVMAGVILATLPMQLLRKTANR